MALIGFVAAALITQSRSDMPPSRSPTTCRGPVRIFVGVVAASRLERPPHC